MNKKINVTNVDKLNKKFANVMVKLGNYIGTDPESVVQAAYNRYFSRYFSIDESDKLCINRIKKLEEDIDSGNIDFSSFMPVAMKEANVDESGNIIAISF